MLNLDNHTAQFHILSIRLAPDGFSFFILDVRDNTIVLFKTITIGEHQDPALIAINTMRAEEVFSFPFKAVRLLLDTPDVTVVPSDVYDEAEKEALFSFNVDLVPNEQVMVNSCSAYNVEVLFSIQKDLLAFFRKNFQNFSVIHNVALMLSQSISYEKRAQEQLFISYSGQHFSVVGLRNNSFIFHNSFRLVTSDDLIYYFLLVLQDLNFDQYQSSAVLSGVIAQDTNELNVIRQYLAHLDFALLPPQYHYSEDIIEMPSHYYSNFFALLSCE